MQFLLEQKSNIDIDPYWISLYNECRGKGERTAVNIDHTLHETETLPTRSCALLWDESFLWGIMAWRAIREAGLPFDLLRFEDVRKGALSRYRMIFVPGGWALNKMSALGDQGMAEIRRFVAGGGNYLGICGGAGMATENGLGLLPIARKSQRERVPSFSGPIRLSCDGHAMWQGIDTTRIFRLVAVPVSGRGSDYQGTGDIRRGAGGSFQRGYQYGGRGDPRLVRAGAALRDSFGPVAFTR